MPIYKLISNTGPRHKPKIKVGVKLKNINQNKSTKIAKEIIKNYYEVIIANGFDKKAIKLLKNKL